MGVLGAGTEVSAILRTYAWTLRHSAEAQEQDLRPELDAEVSALSEADFFRFPRERRTRIGTGIDSSVRKNCFNQ